MERFRPRIEELFNKNIKSEKISEILSEELGYSIAGRTIRNYITKWGLRENIVSSVLEENGLDGETWNTAWIKTKSASVYIKNGTLSLESIREG